MIPLRFRNLRPYLASFVFSRFPRPPLSEIIRWTFQPGKKQRAAKYLQRVADSSDMKEIWFNNYNKPFYYPQNARWIDLCQTIDECLNPQNWHHFITNQTPLKETDIVVDCGAAEGLFSFVAAFTATMVYAIEPIPSWHTSLEKTFANFQNVTLLKCGVAHKKATLRMTDDEIFSRVSADGVIEVSIDTIDSLIGERPITFLKADIEGLEFQMLLGAEETIRRNRPKIALTVYHHGNDFYEMINFLKNLHGDYQFKTRGIASNGNPVLLLAF